MVNSLWIESIHFVASIEVIEAGNVIELIDFTEENELKLNDENQKRRRGRPKLTAEQKAFTRFKREAGKTKKFAVGEEPNKRAV